MVVLWICYTLNLHIILNLKSSKTYENTIQDLKKESSLLLMSLRMNKTLETVSYDRISVPLTE